MSFLKDLPVVIARFKALPPTTQKAIYIGLAIGVLLLLVR